MDNREELLRAADSFDDVLVDADGLCRWTDVAEALQIMRRKLADYTCTPAQCTRTPFAWAYQFKVERPVFSVVREDWADTHPDWTETPLYDHPPLRAPEAIMSVSTAPSCAACGKQDKSDCVSPTCGWRTALPSSNANCDCFEWPDKCPYCGGQPGSSHPSTERKGGA